MLTIALICGTLLVVWTYYKILFRFSNKIPCAQPMVPIFGNSLEFVNKNSVQIFATLARAFRENGRVFKISFGPVPAICPTHPDLIHKVLTDTASMAKPFVYDFLMVEKGLIAAEYESWKSYRKVLNPTFNIRILNSFIPIFTDCASKMIQSMKEHNGSNKPVNIIEFTFPCTLGMICRTTLGSKALEREGTEEFIKGLECIFQKIGIRLFNWNLYLNWIYRLTPNYRAEMKARKYCYAYTDNIIQEKREEFAKLKQKLTENNNETCASNSDETDGGKMLSYKKPQILIDQLLTIPLPNGKPFAHDEMRDNIYTIVAGGIDTSAIQTAHTALLLAMHPEIQERVVAELREVFPTPDTEYTPEVLKELVYLELVIKESLRLCPAAGIFARKTQSDLQLDEYLIPKGNIIILNICDLHRREEFWGEDAAQFNPDRFLPENSKDRHPFAYLPFSGGPRGCIGNRYGMMSVKVMVAEMLRNFRMTTDLKYEDMQFEFRLTLQLAFEHLVYLEPRNFYD